MPTTLDRLYANLGTLITDTLVADPSTCSDEEKLTALAEALYLEVVAEYQPEPDIYGQPKEVIDGKE